MFCADIFGFAGEPPDEPYIEGEARNVPADVESPWVGFWADSRAGGMDKAGVHAFFGVGPEDGALAIRTRQIAELNHVSEGEIIATMRTQLADFIRENNPNAKSPTLTEDEPDVPFE